MDNSGQAFPSVNESNVEGRSFYYPGMSLRDYFAAKALEGFCSNPDISKSAASLGLHGKKLHPSFVASAYELADAMIEERRKKI